MEIAFEDDILVSKRAVRSQQEKGSVALEEEDDEEELDEDDGNESLTEEEKDDRALQQFLTEESILKDLPKDADIGKDDPELFNILADYFNSEGEEEAPTNEGESRKE